MTFMIQPNNVIRISFDSFVIDAPQGRLTMSDGHVFLVLTNWFYVWHLCGSSSDMLLSKKLYRQQHDSTSGTLRIGPLTQSDLRDYHSMVKVEQEVATFVQSAVAFNRTLRGRLRSLLRR